jgi:hypothetical protein
MVVAASRKDLMIIAEAFEFQRIPTGIKQEHRGLFAHFSLETDAGFHHEHHVELAQARCQLLPCRPFEYQAEVANRDVFAVDDVAQGRAALLGSQVRRQLVPLEIEVNPARFAAAFAASKDLDIKIPRGSKVVYGECEVEAGELAHAVTKVQG